MKVLILWLLLYPIIPPVEGSLCTSEVKDFDGFRYPEQIAHCKRNVSTRKKDQICLRDGVYDRTYFTVDHLIPLAIGGSNKDDNLWCQHKDIAVTELEYKLYLELRSGTISQRLAITRMLDAKFNRYAMYYSRYLGPYRTNFSKVFDIEF